MKKGLLLVFIGLLMFFVATDTFAQEVKIIPWGYGLGTSLGITSENSIPNSFSISFQSWHRMGSGWSIDWINQKQTVIGEYLGDYFEINGSQNGLLGSLFLGFPIGDIFRPYVGGGIGIGFYLGDNVNNIVNNDIYFAWKLDAGVQAWLFDSIYINTGYTYDNIRKHSISVGLGFKLKKNVTSTYRNSDGSTFRRTWTRFLWEDNNTPNSIYEDKFSRSEVVRRYQKTTSETVRRPGTVSSEYSLEGGGSAGSSGSVGTLTTYYYVYNVTVTRNWYTRTWYYKDRAPTTENVYEDVESSVLVNQYSR